MTLKEKLAAANAAAQAKVAQLKAQSEKPRVRVYAIVAEAVAKVGRIIWPKERADQHKVGNQCPHCLGSGRYKFHTDAARNEKCYRCDGKGVLDTKDLAFYAKRAAGGGLLCHFATA